MSQSADIDVIIPHYRGFEILARCLDALKESMDAGDLRCEVHVVDNAAEDGSVELAVQAHPWVRTIRSEENLGYAGGCNLGIESTTRSFVVLLNDDAVVTPGWLTPLVEYLQARPECAAVQPKILNLENPAMFDYAGAAGGEMDMLGFPFARGRIFSHLEDDHGQYEDDREIFWASGACTVIRREVLASTGLLDTVFFAHMEEIDLNWRMLLAGFHIAYVPASVVRHNAGSTLNQDAPRKLYLNHRNSLLMLLKNYAWPRLLWTLPLRLGLELASAIEAGFRLSPAHAGAVARSWFALFPLLDHVKRERKRVRALRVRSDREVDRFMYRGSLVWAYFVRGKRVATQLEGST